MTDVEILRKLGESAVATVHLAREPALRRLVAVKSLRPALCDDELAVRRFEREAQSAARISHHHVCAIHRIGRTPNGVPFIVMEYVEGRNLDAFMQAEGRIPFERALTIVAQIAAAIAAAQDSGVIHRDLRPANVLVEDGTGRIVLTDFGIAAIHASGSEIVTRLTREGERLGNPDYASPEQQAGAEVTEATDIYSLGLVALDLFNSGYEGESRSAAGDDFPVPLYRELPPALRDLLRRCLSPIPDNRPNAAAVRDRLAEFVADPDRLQSTGEADNDSVLDAGLGFLAELKRRKVYRVAAGYLAGAIVLVEFLNALGPTLRIPEWLFRSFVAVVLGGFPIAVTLAWMFDITRSGLRRTSAAGIPPSRQAIHLVLQLVGLALSIAAAGAVGWWIFDR